MVKYPKYSKRLKLNVACKWLGEVDHIDDYETALMHLNQTSSQTFLKSLTVDILGGFVEAYPSLGLGLLKETIMDVLQVEGIEITFVDDTWDSLTEEDLTTGYIINGKRNHKVKPYLFEYFEN